MKQIKINEKDNVAVMLEGELCGHKIALNDIKKGENIIKYGYPIGHATEDIKKGDHIHIGFKRKAYSFYYAQNKKKYNYAN